MDKKLLDMPYCFQKIDDSKWIMLNRKYAQLGTIFELNNMPISNFMLSFTNVKDDKYFLYNDACMPYRTKGFTNNYTARLGKLILYMDGFDADYLPIRLRKLMLDSMKPLRL